MNFHSSCHAGVLHVWGKDEFDRASHGNRASRRGRREHDDRRGARAARSLRIVSDTSVCCDRSWEDQEARSLDPVRCDSTVDLRWTSIALRMGNGAQDWWQP